MKTGSHLKIRELGSNTLGVRDVALKVGRL